MKIAKVKLYVRYVVILGYVLVLATCIWLFIACEGHKEVKCKLTWIDDLLKQKHINDLRDVITFSMYRVASLLTGGGIGDVMPHTTYERLIATALMLFGFWGSGYLQAVVTSHIRTVANEQDVHKLKMTQFIASLKANGVK